mgnify:FL=1
MFQVLKRASETGSWCQVVTRHSLIFILAFLLVFGAASAQEAGDDVETATDAVEQPSEGENASNPLAAVSNTDLRWQYLDLKESGARLNDYFVEGALMLNPKLKFMYELHYWDTNQSGSSHGGFESALVKLIYFPRQGRLESGTGYRLAAGIDYIHDLGDTEKGIGFGADQLGPFLGVALALPSGITVIPLLQHFTSVSGVDVNTTAARLIALKPFGDAWWLKLDAKLPYDWENESIPADAQFQLGKTVKPGLGLYVDGMFGLGSERIYDWGVGVGLRFNY